MSAVSAKALLSDGARLALRHPGAFLRTQGILVAASALLSVALYVALGVSPQAFPEGPARPPLWAFLGLAVAEGLLMIVGLGLGIVAADAAWRNERIGLAQAWRRLAPRLPNLLATVAAMAAFLFFILFVFGLLPVVGSILGLGIVLLFRGAWALAEPVSVLERNAIGANFDASKTRTDRCVGALALVTTAVALVLGFPLLLEVLLRPAALPDATLAWTLLGVGLAAKLAGGFLWSATAVAAYHRLAPAPDPAPTSAGPVPDAPPTP